MTAQITREQYDAAVEVIDQIKYGGEDDTDVYTSRLLEVLGIEDPYTEPPSNEFRSIVDGDDDGSAIVIRPVARGNGVEWDLYIPPTTADAISDRGLLRLPFGKISWFTLEGAIQSLSMAHRQGLIKFNDGRVVE